MKSDPRPARKPAPGLTLNRETLRRLEREQLAKAEGGGPPPGLATTEEWSSCPPCDS